MVNKIIERKLTLQVATVCGMLRELFPTMITHKVVQDITAPYHPPRIEWVEDIGEGRSFGGIGGHSDDGGQHARIMPMNNEPIKEGNILCTREVIGSQRCYGELEVIFLAETTVLAVLGT
jgi:hypothetical protein